MNIFEKIKKSWWVILSFIMFLNGFGFIYIAVKYNNKNWLLEGVMYELPWFLYFVFYALFGAPSVIPMNQSMLILLLAVLLLFVSIIRSVWVAIKLADVYENEEKYTISSTSLNNSKNSNENKDFNSNLACCLCALVIFFVFIVVIL